MEEKEFSLRPCGRDFDLTEDNLENVKDRALEFELWARTLLPNGKLNQVAEALIKSGEVNTPQDALNYLNDFSRQNPLKKLAIASCDLKGETRQELFRMLENSLQESDEKSNPLALYRRHGAISHRAIPDFLCGIFPPAPNFKEANQPALFAATEPVQGPLFPAESFLNGERFRKEIKSGGAVSNKLLKQIEKCWRRANATVDLSRNWMEIYEKGSKFVPELYEMFLPIFGEKHLNELQIFGGSFNRYLSLLTLLGWATAVPRLALSGRKILFRELPVLAHTLGLGGGRLDAAEILTINDKPPNASQKEILANLMRVRFPSVGYLVKALEKKFKNKILLRLIDWKFAVGDGENGEIIKPQDLLNPKSKHQRQLCQYMTLAALDEYTLSGAKGDIWREGHFTYGQLVYFLPNSPPVIHDIIMEPSAQEKTFIQEVAAKMPEAEQRARLREQNNLLVGHVLGLLNGRKKNGARPNGKNKSRQNQPSFPRHHPSLMIKEAAEKIRRFADENKIIECLAERDGSEYRFMHLDKLFAAIEEGKINYAKNFSFARGGHISCLLHNDPGPSMYVYLEKGFFKCFGCGAFGTFAPHSVPAEINLQIREYKKIFQENKKTAGVFVPEEHHLLMTEVQKILQSYFWESEAEKYLRKDRGLDPELAYEFGAGFGTEAVVDKLLESGKTYQELIDFGFIGFSSALKSHQGLAPLLKNRGMKSEEIQREIKLASQKSVPGLPFFKLQGRVTFPLDYEGKLTNFYGRATWPCRREDAHRKLAFAKSGVRHGAFKLRDSGDAEDEIIIIEAAMDALTLAMLNYKNIWAVIGGDNILVLESAARSRKQIAVALDNDETGKNNTIKISERLRRAGFEGTIRNFTQDFIKQVPSAGNCKDFNEWWIKEGKNLSGL